MQFANRTRELGLFVQMINGQNGQTERILLIEAPSGYGKTNLLLQFERKCPQAVRSAWVDLKSAQIGAPYVFSRIRKKLGVTRFPAFTRTMQQFLGGGVQVENNELRGQENQLQVILNVADENRDYRLAALQEAFFHDLSQFNQPILLILDTFNEAPESLAQWIGGGFLAEVADLLNVYVVLAGQHVPQPTGEWLRCTQHCPLDRIVDQEAWYKYAKDKGLSFNRDQVGMAVQIFAGLPAEIVKTLEALDRQGSA